MAQAYQLKQIRYKNTDCRILLQNENGPCPLLAAVNCLLLKDVIHLPAACIRNSVASLQDVVNLLAEQAMTYSSHDETSNNDDSNSSSNANERMFLDELLQVLPKLQFGMDVNPKFTQGIAGYEYTSQLSAFDMLRVRLVHGWLMDPNPVSHGGPGESSQEQHDQLMAAVDNKSYNQVVELVIHGKEAESQLSRVHHQMDELKAKQMNAMKVVKEPPSNQNSSESWDLVDTATATEGDGDANTTTNAADTTTAENAATAPAATAETSTTTAASSTEGAVVDTKQETPASLQLELDELEKKYNDISKQARIGAQIEDFLNHTGHQLTHYGLSVLYETLPVGELAVFFRNNHFGTLTKHEDGQLYLLVTDLGYAHTPDICWEKLDMIDGDTELVNSQFQRGAPRTQTELLATGPSLSPEQLLAQSGQNDADYHLALHLSMQNNEQGGQGGQATPDLDAQEGQLVAAATEASLREYNGIKDGTSSSGSGGGGDPASNGNTAAGQVEVGVPVSPPPGGGTVVSLPPKAGDTSTASPATIPPATPDDSDHRLAMQLQGDQDRSEEASLRLAHQLQAQENQRANTDPSTNRRSTRASNSASSTASKCVIS